jgi:hypothetical protein
MSGRDKDDTDEGQAQLIKRLEQLTLEHRDLDEVISRWGLNLWRISSACNASRSVNWLSRMRSGLFIINFFLTLSPDRGLIVG